uniref:Envelope glycoprotein n=1 Tax=Heterorhabditis bacteriophora TaxID=37862 RepID=A0A1I7WKC9_HETBA
MILFCTLLWKISGEYGWEICVYCAEYSVSGHHTFNLQFITVASILHITGDIQIPPNQRYISACELDCVFLSLTNKYHWTLQPLNTTITLPHGASAIITTRFRIEEMRAYIRSRITTAQNQLRRILNEVREREEELFAEATALCEGEVTLFVIS